MNTNELIQHLESTITMLSRDLRFISEQISENKELIAPLVGSIDDTMNALASYLKVFITSLDNTVEEEKALKNQAYFFIIHSNKLEAYKEFCAACPIDEVKKAFPINQPNE